MYHNTERTRYVLFVIQYSPRAFGDHPLPRLGRVRHARRRAVPPRGHRRKSALRHGDDASVFVDGFLLRFVVFVFQRERRARRRQRVLARARRRDRIAFVRHHGRERVARRARRPRRREQRAPLRRRQALWCGRLPSRRPRRRRLARDGRHARLGAARQLRDGHAAVSARATKVDARVPGALAPRQEQRHGGEADERPPGEPGGAPRDAQA
mmetsp:Transcript_7095/g.29301  ORF Transcript_7095/g.29301 Transcript_7095/m.29301 type:complete len:211 (+) Transcript_7095:25-657(+)